MVLHNDPVCPPYSTVQHTVAVLLSDSPVLALTAAVAAATIAVAAPSDATTFTPITNASMRWVAGLRPACIVANGTLLVLDQRNPSRSHPVLVLSLRFEGTRLNYSEQRP